MATENAPTNLEELKELLKDDIKVKVAGVDVDGVLRGKYMSKSKFLSAVKSDFGFCSVIFGWDLHDETYSRELLISNKANGYRDILARIDLSTYRRLPFEYNLPFFLLTFLDPDTKEPVSACPRGLLGRTMDKVRKLVDGADGLAGVEYEYFQFKETPESLEKKQWTGLTALTPGRHGYSVLRPLLNNEYFHDLHNKAEAFGIQIEAHHTETGPGVFETALAYTNALRVSDNAILFKLLAKTAGVNKGIIPSFMAKPYGNLPGCSGHIHVSLRSPEGVNLFACPEGRSDAAFKDTKYLSELGEQFLAGVVRGLPDIMPMLCPTINSYKRLVAGEAFWAPNMASYGYDSRAASIRIIGPPGVAPEATRFEVRVPGADMNPFFALGAVFALGLRGIEQKLTLPYGPVGAPGVTPQTLPKLATDLDAAVQAFKREGSIARECFGDEFVDHFAGTREHEVNVWKQAVTSWEVERYLELA
ncbi:glutamine synthetase guanido kinase [Phaffia rhodozyma]|uniref:Glutamine synthetase guanido kinase n=1 Tax=Phaffia rhodozyma TaxID=264483 RepID=A0A0F7STI3_PHARH|nr:glutamine synthetase guanido kinase [Phaffia rhodozyma]